MALVRSPSIPVRGTAAGRLRRLGGADGNEALTRATAVVLTLLLMAEGVTLLQLNGLLGAHMFIGMALIPPVLLKLGSTGYRMLRYYTGSRVYREKGPPALPLRLLAPVLAVTTVAILGTGVWLLVLGHRSDGVMFVHKAAFVIWSGAFAIHFLAYLPRVAGSLLEARSVSRGGATAAAGNGLRTILLVACTGGGIALAISLLSAINAWHGGADGG